MADLSLEDESRPTSPIIIGQEWVESDCDSYHHEDNEDEVMNNETFKHTDEEEEEKAEKARALEASSVPREKKVRQKDLPNQK